MISKRPWIRSRRSVRLTKASRQGFTLVELMVVIAIIAVLISILLPSLGAVRTNVKVATSKVAISVLETGIQQFQADTRVGGSLPPSSPPPTALPGYTAGQVLSPHTGKKVRIYGASLLVWALAGADVLGTPGFADLNGNNTWADDTASVSSATSPQPLYALDTTEKPVCTRSGPFVDLSKMKLPKPTATRLFEIPAAVGSTPGHRCLNSLCFLDSFGQPILYYKANVSNSLMVGTATNPGVYNMTDNENVTTVDGTCNMDGTCNGMDFGRGAINSASQYHWIGIPGEGAVPGKSADEVFAAMQDPANRSFSRTVWNRNVVATPRPHNDKSFILLSAGPDGVFGTADDLANFEVNK